MRKYKEGWEYIQAPIGLSKESSILIQKRVTTLRANPQKFRDEIQSDIHQVIKEIEVQKSIQLVTRSKRTKKHHQLLTIQLKSTLNQYLRILDTLN